MSVVETPTLVPSDTLLALLDGIAHELLMATQPRVRLSGLNSTDQQIVSRECSLAAVLLNARVVDRTGGRAHVAVVPSYNFASRIKGPACYLGLIEADGSRKLFTIGAYSPGMVWSDALTGEALAAAKQRYDTSERQRDARALGKRAADDFVAKLARNLSDQLCKSKLTLSAPRQADLDDFLRERQITELGLEDLATATVICNVSLQRLTWDDTP